MVYGDADNRDDFHGKKKIDCDKKKIDCDKKMIDCDKKKTEMITMTMMMTICFRQRNTNHRD